MILAIATMTKNQSNRLKEWVLYHNSLGFNKFIIFLDNCTDNSAEVLNFIDGVDIDVFFTSKINDGKYMNKHWIKRSHNMYDYVLEKYSWIDWIAFIEVDEFIVQQEENVFLFDFLESTDSSSIYINSWDMKPPFDEDRAILGQSKMIWTDRQRYESDHRYRGKSIIRPSQFEKCIDAHHFKHKEFGVSKDFKSPHVDFLQVNQSKEVLIDDNKFRIYHYRNHTPKHMKGYDELKKIPNMQNQEKKIL
jgi:hypothetical protein